MRYEFVQVGLWLLAGYLQPKQGISMGYTRLYVSTSINKASRKWRLKRFSQFPCIGWKLLI